MYKKQSFKQVKANILDKATKIRSEWKQENIFFRFVIRILQIFNNPNLPLVMCMIRNFRMISDKEKKEFKKEAFLLAKKLKKELIKEGFL